MNNEIILARLSRIQIDITIQLDSIYHTSVKGVNHFIVVL